MFRAPVSPLFEVVAPGGAVRDRGLGVTDYFARGTTVSNQKHHACPRWDRTVASTSSPSDPPPEKTRRQPFGPCSATS